MAMNLQITKDEKEPLLSRREIGARLGYEARTPSRNDIRKEIAKNLNVKEELVVVKRIKPELGTQAARLEIDVYDDEKAMSLIEPGYMLKRHSPGEKKEEKAEAKEEKAPPANEAQ
ncbi:MAG TPA: 30S ribosomal protein S24e [Candidatus Nanoarchaeia archaeon]|nr:30S ribosomal protein S24e [Candidatus Nanoarchaeia archaeon]